MIIIALIAFLGTSVYFYQESRHLQKTLAQEKSNFSSRLEQVQDDCESRIARIRHEHQQKLADSSARAPQDQLSSFLKMMQEHRQKAHENLIQEITLSLELNEQETQEVLSVVAYLENQQKILKNKAVKQGLHIFDPQYLKQVEKYRQQAMELLRQALPEEKYQAFLEHGFHEKLNLKTHQP